MPMTAARGFARSPAHTVGATHPRASEPDEHRPHRQSERSKQLTERVLDIPDQVTDVFDPDRQADEIGGDLEQ